MIASEFLDDHRFAVVCRPQQEKTLRPNAAWFVFNRGAEQIERNLCLRVADPPLATDEGNSLRIVLGCNLSQIEGKVAEICHHHLSIGNGDETGA